MIKQFEQNYAVRDKQDVLAMCALQFATQTLNKTTEKSTIDESTIVKLENLNTILSKYIED
jgi:cell division protein ZapA